MSSKLRLLGNGSETVERRVLGIQEAEGSSGGGGEHIDKNDYLYKGTGERTKHKEKSRRAAALRGKCTSALQAR